MRFSFGFPLMAHPQNPDFLAAPAIAELARAAEAAGFDSCSFTEHPLPNDAWLTSGGHDALDPFVALAVAATATTRLRLLTNLTPVPYRNPAILAKTVATLDRLSGGRVILGAGVGYLESEFEAVGVDFAQRNALFDECLEVMRMIWTGESVNYRGSNFSIAQSTALPTPVQSPVPVWIGGNSKLSRRRVAESAQGWMPMPNPRSLASRRRSAPLETLDELALMIAYMRDHAEAVGRTEPIDIQYMDIQVGAVGSPAWNPQLHLENIAALSKLGVTSIAAYLTGDTRSQVAEAIGQYGEEVIASL
ncbi:LLM class F420-dependent oxidoreductase [Candidatus Poriferisocius sp.]|uniref:LLM class F420-dependent oxidoreductase n=1 Tax=Candidatus Poriferisocius sp. TaxID=3101276 RepID=UPI003B027C06